MYKILILDDEKAVRDSLVSHFEDNDYEVYSAENAEIAIEVVEKKELDCAIVDLRLPGKTGFDFVNYIYPKTEKMGFIIYTGSTNTGMPQNIQILSRVYDKIIQKPIFDLDDMDIIVEELIQKIREQ